jgi:hypothetical protein
MFSLVNLTRSGLTPEDTPRDTRRPYDLLLSNALLCGFTVRCKA